MKVLMVDSLVGNEYALCLCQGLHDSGMEVELVTTENRDVPIRYTFPVLFIAPSKESGKNRVVKLVKYAGYLGHLLRLPHERGANVLHFQFFRRDKVESLIFPIFRLLGVTLVHTAHNVLPHENSRIDYYLKYLVYLSSHKIIVHSQYIRTKLLHTFSINREKVVVIPHGNFDVYLPEEQPSKSEARKSLGLPVEEPMLLFFGYIRAYKGVDILLEAFKEAAPHLPTLNLVIAGEPYSAALGNRYAQKISQMPYKQRVKYIPEFIPNDDVAIYFNAADAIVLPYTDIDHSGIVHLAYSFGKPIIASDIGDFNEVIEGGKCGFITPTNDVPGLARTIKEAFGNIKRLQEMGDFITALNRTKYSWDAISMKTRAIYLMKNQNILN